MEQPHVLLYEHEHGVDVTVCTTRKIALRGMVEIILMYWGDSNEPDWNKSDCRAALLNKDFEAAMAAFNRDHPDEKFSISQHYVESKLDPIDIAARIAAEEEGDDDDES